MFDLTIGMQSASKHTQFSGELHTMFMLGKRLEWNEMAYLCAGLYDTLRMARKKNQIACYLCLLPRFYLRNKMCPKIRDEIWYGGWANSSTKDKQKKRKKTHRIYLVHFSGFQSYVVLTTEEILLDVESSARIISYYLITYGLSFTIVAISLGIDPSAYTIKADACVWMEQSYLFYTTFLMPCFVYILVIVCFYINMCVCVFEGIW